MKRKSKWIIPAVILAAALLALFFWPRGSQTIQEGNLLLNGSFEKLNDHQMPQDWYTDDYLRTPGYTEYSAEAGVITIVNHDYNDARFAQQVEVRPDSLYCFSGEIRAEATGGWGANLSVADVYAFSECVYDSEGEWQSVRIYGRTGDNQKQVTVFARLGGYSGEAVGTASFRNLSLEQVKSVPAEYVENQWYRESSHAVESDNGVGSPAWPWLLMIALAYAAACYLLRGQAMGQQARGIQAWPVILMLLLAAALRVIIALLIPGYGVDIGCFTYWGEFMAHTGAADFYNTVGFCDYPPGYILVLGLLGKIGDALGTGMTELLVKLPSILCDVAAAAVLYRFAKKRVSPKNAFVLAALYAFNPLTFAAGAAWGQADSVMALCLLLVVIEAIENRWVAALPLYMLSVLLKPQALMFGPLGLIAFLYALIRKKDQKLYIQSVVGMILAAVVALLVILPFSPHMDNSEGWWIINLYGGTMGYYANVTVNACNLYFLFGLNWIGVADEAAWYIRPIVMTLLLGGVLMAGFRFQWYKKNTARKLALFTSLAAVVIISLIPMTYSQLGTLVIVLGVILCALLYAAGRDIRHLPLLGALLLILLCNLGVMMHERYLFPAALLLALACVLEKDTRVYLLFALVSAALFLNVGVVLDRGIRIGGVEGHLSAPAFGISSDSGIVEYGVSVIQLGITLLAGLTCASICAEGQRLVLKASVQKEIEESDSIPSPALRELKEPQHIAPMKAVDWLLMLGVTAVYAVVALTNLGSTTSPQTWWRSTSSSDQIVLDLGQIRAANMLYLGGIHSRPHEFIVRVSDDGEEWSDAYWAQILEGQCFEWQYLRDSYQAEGERNYSTTPVILTGRYVRIEARSIATTLYEVILRDPNTQEVFPVSLVSGEGQNLIDEQDTLKGDPGWYNSTYFDEIYHARTGYEHYLAMQGDTTYYPYETSHPPLGKVLIAFAISIFGMTPFGWRFAGAMAGVLMLPGMYLLGKLVTRRRITAFAAMFLMAVDFMHFTQTRIATIDSFVVLFIIWSFVFMVYYARMDYWGKALWETLVPLCLSGVFMGLAVASKWTGCYAGVGLALLFFWSLYRRFRQSLAAREMADTPRAEAAAREIYRRPVITLLSCLVFFVAIPAGIYYASYIPYFLPYTPPGVSVKRVIEAAQGMLGYHSTPGLGMDHPFYSPWYQWPIMGKPMWYYSSTYRPAGMSQTIVAFGNPAVWWGGLAGLAAVMLIWLLRHIHRDGLSLHTRVNDMRPAILLIGLAAQYVPWTLVPRGTYIYHYFPSIPFIILCIALALDSLFDCAEKPIQLPAFYARFLVKWHGWFGNPISDDLKEKAEKVYTIQGQRWPLILTLLWMAVALGLFVAFFPYISGCWASNAWLRAMQWFRGWIYY